MCSVCLSPMQAVIETQIIPYDGFKSKMEKVYEARVQRGLNFEKESLALITSAHHITIRTWG